MKKSPVLRRMPPEMEAEVLKHLPLARKLSSKYRFLGAEDPYGVAVEALVKAAAYFDPDKGFGFHVLARRCITNSLLQQLDNNDDDDHTIKFSTLTDTVGDEDGFARDLDGESLTSPSSTEDWTELLIDATDAQESFSVFLASLDGRERKLVDLKLADTPSAQVPTLLGCSQPTASRILKSARAKFRLAFGS